MIGDAWAALVSGATRGSLGDHKDPADGSPDEQQKDRSPEGKRGL
jgi:hypothetical protein